MFKVIICLLNGRFPKYKFPLKVEGQSPYSIIICILCSVAMNCIIQDHVYNVQLAALYVPPFCTTKLEWYDWANEATSKHALEICVNLCNYWGPYSVFIASMVMIWIQSHISTICSQTKLQVVWELHMKLWTMRCQNAEKIWRCLHMIQQGISLKHVADTLGCSRCAVQGLLDHHTGNTHVSYLPSFCRPRCTTITVRQVWQLVRHCLGRRTWTMCSWLGH